MAKTKENGGNGQQKEGRSEGRPNILILCIDQWEAHMKLPEGVRLPALERLEQQGVSFDRHGPQFSGHRSYQPHSVLGAQYP